MSAMFDKVVIPPEVSMGGAFASKPRVVVEHGLEAPSRNGMVDSLTGGYFLNGDKISVHAVVGPDKAIGMAPLNRIAYHCGGGNRYSIGIEHTGYAAWTPDQWYETSAFAALRRGAEVTAKICLQLGIRRRWLSIAQIKAGEDGVCTHNDARLAWGGTTHYDLGPGFDNGPAAKYMQMVRQFAGDDVITPQPNPNPAPTGTVGGAEAEEDDMKQYIIKAADGKVYHTSSLSGILTHLVDQNALDAAVNIGKRLKLEQFVWSNWNDGFIPLDNYVAQLGVADGAGDLSPFGTVLK